MRKSNKIAVFILIIAIPLFLVIGDWIFASAIFLILILMFISKSKKEIQIHEMIMKEMKNKNWFL
ncbi:MAG: hypothetical protein GF387_02925 [Candidatus Portnoybacteria bacterium]|nr:hypothetical protein [Candidatus Portnoybacteria bacterium]